MNNEPAFPITNQGVNIDSGLTKLEYFAAHAHVEISDNPSIPYYEALVGRGHPANAGDYAGWRAFWDDVIACLKIGQAKALLAALEKEQSNGK